MSETARLLLLLRLTARSPSAPQAALIVSCRHIAGLLIAGAY
jgi:hypothetical protein